MREGNKYKLNQMQLFQIEFLLQNYLTKKIK